MPFSSVEQASNTTPHTKKRGRPKKKAPIAGVTLVLDTKKNERNKEDTNNNDTFEDGNVDQIEERGDETEEPQNSCLVEMRILGTGNVLKKVFADKSLTCESPVEANMYHVLIEERKSLSCSYCGEIEDNLLFSKLTVDCFPLCLNCQKKGRGAAPRRKSRKIVPKVVKK